MSHETGLLLVRIGFSEACKEQTSWRDWAAMDWCETTFDFFTKAHWLSEDCSVAWMVVLDEPFYRQRIISLQASRDVSGVTVRPLN